VYYFFFSLAYYSSSCLENLISGDEGRLKTAGGISYTISKTTTTTITLKNNNNSVRFLHIKLKLNANFFMLIEIKYKPEGELGENIYYSCVYSYQLSMKFCLVVENELNAIWYNGCFMFEATNNSTYFSEA
jgi:hypothetical protein